MLWRIGASAAALIDQRYMFQDIYLLDLETGEYTLAVDVPGKLGSYRISPDAKHLAWTAAASRSDHAVSSLYFAKLDGSGAVNLTGESFAGHEILRRVGEGGMGVVYAARDGRPRAVAVKVLKPDRAASERHLRAFLDEAAATGAVGHENVVRILGGGKERGLYYFLMELVDGPPLSRFRL